MFSLIFLGKTFNILWWIESSKAKHLFQIFCNPKMSVFYSTVCTVTIVYVYNNNYYYYHYYILKNGVGFRHSQICVTLQSDAFGDITCKQRKQVLAGAIVNSPEQCVSAAHLMEHPSGLAGRVWTDVYESLMGPLQPKWSDKKKPFLSSYTMSLPSQTDLTNTTACVCWVNKLKCEIAALDLLFIQCHTGLWWLEDNLRFLKTFSFTMNHWTENEVKPLPLCKIK